MQGPGFHPQHDKKQKRGSIVTALIGKGCERKGPAPCRGGQVVFFKNKEQTLQSILPFACFYQDRLGSWNQSPQELEEGTESRAFTKGHSLIVPCSQADQRRAGRDKEPVWEQH